MTNQEFDIEFDILYNSISNNSAPALTEYEKSVFLTNAQEKVVIELCNLFERSEHPREMLSNLITSYSVNSTEGIKLEKPIVKNSLCFKLPDDLLYIVYESLTASSEKCGEVNVIVKPTKYDDFFKTQNNPFQCANFEKALRIDINNSTISDEELLDQSKRYVEIISSYSNYDYNLRYIKKPEPIIITEPDTTTLPEGLTIDGIKDETECKLNTSLHRTILESAVRLAMSVYNSNIYQNRNNKEQS